MSPTASGVNPTPTEKVNGVLIYQDDKDDKVKEQKEEVERIFKSRVYTRDSRKQWEGDRYKLAITDLAAVHPKHIIDSESVRIVA